MRNTVLALVAVALASCALAENLPPTPDVFYLDQKLSHFNKSEERTFSQRVLVYSKNYKKGGPLFFCPGGESDVFGGYNHNGFMWELGDPLNAFYLFPEHRFYGQSLPDGPVNSYKPETIQYLRIEEALADFASVITFYMKEYDIPDHTPIISFGGSYPGELAAFLRISGVVDGALASSAPVMYHQGLTPAVPSGAFFQVVTEDFAGIDARCPDLVRQAFATIIANSDTAQGRAQMSQQLGLCTPYADNQGSLRNMILWAENAFAEMGMADYPYSISGLNAHPFNLSCAEMLRPVTSTNTLVNNLGKAIGICSYNNTGSTKCFDIASEYYPCADITGCGGGIDDPDALSWDYQSCTEVVSNVDTNNQTDMFPAAPYNFTAIQAYCKTRWNTSPDPLHIPQTYPVNSKTSRIIFSNGKLDPWYPGGILQNVSSSVISLMIDDAAHHLDLHGSDPNDPPAVIAARKQESAIILGWLKEIEEEKKQQLAKIF